MKPTFDALERYRHKEPGRLFSQRGWRCGAFLIPHGRGDLVTIVSDGTEDHSLAGWEHVSVHYREYNPNRMMIPSWTQMCFVKDLFWSSDECVIQFHPPKSEYVNEHPYTLHLWKQIGVQQPQPPSILVGNKS